MTIPDYSHLQLLNKLQTWMTNNKVILNDNKTTVLHLHTSSHDIPPLSVSINSSPLQAVQSTKLLSFTIDNKLTWNKHVNSLIKSATYHLSPTETQEADDIAA